MRYAICILPAVTLVGVAYAATSLVDRGPSAGTHGVPVVGAGTPRLATAATTPTIASATAAEATSDWARIVDDTLVYRTNEKGDRIIDFSTAGYGGGGVALPSGGGASVMVQPSGGDDTAAIQQAIDTMAARAVDADGMRGVVKLAAGDFRITATLRVNQSGVIVAGAGSGTGGTTVRMTGDTGFLAFQLGKAQTRLLSNRTDLTARYITAGSLTVGVASTAGFAVGQRVEIARNVTADWIGYLGMDTLVRDGQPQTWLAPGSTIRTPRQVVAVDPVAGTITLDAPLTDSFDATYLGYPVGSIGVASYPGQITQVGVRAMTIAAPSGTKVFSAVAMDNVMDGFIADVIGQDTQNAFDIAVDSRRITLDRVVNSISVAQTAGAPTADFSVTGSQVLLNKCASSASGTWAFVTGTAGVGPVVLLNFSTTRSVGIGPHQRWYTGILVDTATLPNATTDRPGIAFTNRGNLGSGQGWTTGWSVAWNVVSPYFKVQAAPGSMNWCIGCRGARVSASPSGTYSAQNAIVAPASLYLQQLKERRGPSALAAIGYTSTTP